MYFWFFFFSYIVSFILIGILAIVSYKKLKWLEKMRKKIENEMENKGTYKETVFKKVLHDEEYIHNSLYKLKGFKNSDTVHKTR